MGTVPLTLLFSDGAARTIDAEVGQSIVSAAEAASLTLFTDCCNGQCGTCSASLVSGSIDMGAYDRAILPDADREGGAILACVSRVTGPCVIELPYDVSDAEAQEQPPISGRVIAVDNVAEETIRLEIQPDAVLSFQSGQYVRIRAGQEGDWRSYSMANPSGSTTLVFYIRTVRSGLFSTWLTERAAIGDVVQISHPHGSFFLRDELRPRLFMAGGTGLAPFLSMLQQIARAGALAWQPTTLLLGVRSIRHLFGLEELESLRKQLPDLKVQFAAETEADERCHPGYATDLVTSLQLEPETRVYVCGPPPMVEAGRSAAAAAGLSSSDLLCERFA